jgi:Tat protein translocase TatB subunit
MLRSMFGIGGSEIIVILVVALLFLGPDKLPDAAKTISKGIRDLKKQSRALQNQIESDEQIGGAIRDLKSALRGDDIPARPPVRREPPKLPENNIAGDAPALTGGHDEPRDDGHDSGGDVIGANTTPPEAVTAAELIAPGVAVTLPPVAGDHDPDADPPVRGDELGHLIKPAAGTVAKKHG